MNKKMKETPITERYCELLRLRREGKTAKEIAEYLGCSLPNVNAMIQRMRTKGIQIPQSARREHSRIDWAKVQKEAEKKG